MFSSFVQRVQFYASDAKGGSQQMRNYLIASYHHRAQHFKGGSDNEVSTQPDIVTMNEKILKDTFTSISNEILNSCKMMVYHKLEKMTPKQISHYTQMQEKATKVRQLLLMKFRENQEAYKKKVQETEAQQNQNEEEDQEQELAKIKRQKAKLPKKFFG